MFYTIAEIAVLKHLKKRLMGVDLGDKTIGLSLSDLTWTIATPYKTLERQGLEKSSKELIKIIDEFQICGLVFGYPINMNGSEGPQSQKVRAFAEKFQSLFDIPVLLWDERMSTMAVTRTMLDADLSRKRQKEVVDKMAASFILQGVLDAIGKDKI
jgi:putative Holliday junction resolvase